MNEVTPSLMGLEVELAFAVPSALPRSPRRRSGHEALLRALVRRVREKVSGLPGSDGPRWYLSNGGCFYVDAGSHPELCTPECRSPQDLVRYALAGERLLGTCVEELAAEQSISLFLGKHNVDYASGATWGCHESYLHRVEPRRLSTELMPHLISRQIFTGAGGFDSRSPGLTFLLSPRVPHLEYEVSSHSTDGRGIFHTKNEPLCAGGYRRLHLICGESLCSETALWLRAATTSLLLTLIEMGVSVSRGLQPHDALESLHLFSQDPTLTVRVGVGSGRVCRSAIEIQQRLLQKVEAHLEDSRLPPWAMEACQLWRSTLDRLADPTSRGAGRLDWSTKHLLYGKRLATHGLEWADVDALSRACEILYCPRSGEDRSPRQGLSPRKARAQLNEEEGRELDATLEERELRRDALERFPAIRAELQELDVRFSELPEGVFARLDRAGALAHHVAGVEAIDTAMHHPPEGSRAQLRGQTIAALSEEPKGRYCTWHRIHDFSRSQILDLSDPFTTTAEWADFSEGDELSGRPSSERLQAMLEQLHGERRSRGDRVSPLPERERRDEESTPQLDQL